MSSIPRAQRPIRPACRPGAIASVLAIFMLFCIACQVSAQTSISGTPGRFAPGRAASPLTIKLRSMEIDLANGPQALPAQVSSKLLTSPATSRAGMDYLIVQFDGPITPERKAALEAIGARIHEYIPDYAFLVGIRPGAKHLLAKLDGLRGDITYLPRFKFDKPIRPKTATAANASATPQSADLLDLTIVGFKGEDLDDLKGSIIALGGSVLDASDGPAKLKLSARVPAAAFEDLAAIPSVRWIEESPEFKAVNNLVASSAECNVRDVWNTHGLRGSGITVAVADSGLDRGSITPTDLNDDFEDGSGNSRVLAILDVNGDGDVSDTLGHGTHVSGSVLGNGSNSGSGPTMHWYPSTCYAGMAPEASLVFQSVGNGTNHFFLPPDLNTLFDEARANNASIHSNSWGNVANGGYDSYSQDLDENVWANRDFCIVFAAMNEGRDANHDGVVDLSSIGAPGTVKNCITVGASEHIRLSGGNQLTWGDSSPSSFPTNPIKDDLMSNSISGMAAFSSRGPCNDGRRKPDIVAPGTNVLSVRSPFAGPQWLAFDDNYSYGDGTSMATPLVAGMAALTREFFVTGNCPGISSPSAALIKATLLNGATDISPGQYGTGATREIPARPNNVEGWGLANLNDSLFDNGLLKHLFVDNTSGVNTGDEIYYDARVVSGALPLRVTLVWTDAPGSLARGGGLVLSCISPLILKCRPLSVNAAILSVMDLRD